MSVMDEETGVCVPHGILCCEMCRPAPLRLTLGEETQELRDFLLGGTGEHA